MTRPWMNPLDVHPENVWLYRQNKPSLIADDFERYGIPRHVTYAILMARGVFKWLAVRRDLIKLKDHWRGEVNRCIAAIRQAKRGDDAILLAHLRGRLAAYEECRAEVRALCHSDRWRAPDFDGDAWQWLVARAPFVATRAKWLSVVRRIRHGRLGSDELAEEVIREEVVNA